MDTKDILHITATLSRMIGEKQLLEELDAIGWRGINSHPVEFFQGYLAEFIDDPELEDKIDMIKGDINRVANLHGFELNGDEFTDIIPR